MHFSYQAEFVQGKPYVTQRVGRATLNNAALAGQASGAIHTVDYYYKHWSETTQVRSILYIWPEMIITCVLLFQIKSQTLRSQVLRRGRTKTGLAEAAGGLELRKDKAKHAAERKNLQRLLLNKQKRPLMTTTQGFKTKLHI